MRPHNDQGFTLTEALVALLVISLGLAGLLQTSRIVGHFNKSALNQRQEAKSMKAFQAEMQTRLDPIQPINDSKLEGDELQIRYACTREATTRDCHLNAPQGHFVYASDGEALAAWPPAAVEGRHSQVNLDAVMLRSPQGKTLALVKFPVEHGADCQFDMISRECREETSSQ
ncbi:MAG TPA: prepilin-type N-terminal cleavage/methylation domain-containing protein [Asticcacaulis sp.]|nr:prepilin-type N-terminal cleavage/methylation domain-containing protein [Asticcacaulis sp.]